MLKSGLFFWYLAFYQVLAQGSALKTCNLNFNLMKNNKKVDIKEMCKTVPCLTKCCAEGQILFKKNMTHGYCENTSYLEMTYKVKNLEDYSRLQIYNKDIRRKIIKTYKRTSDFTIIHYENFTFCDVRQNIFKFMNPHVLENGSLMLRVNPNRIRWIESFNMGEFCFENSFSINATSPIIVFYRKVKSSPDKQKRAVISANCMMVSCVFMVLVLVVYSLLKELRNLAGLMLMAYVATFMAFFLLRVIHVYAHYYKMLYSEGCIVMTLFVYYALLSSFCWMNIMSFDIWWTLRATRRNLPTNRRGVLVKFAWYALYGWGAPLLPTAFVVLADHVDLPGIVKPRVFKEGGCFFGEDSHKYYVRFAIAILVCANFVWFVLTTYNIWRVRRAVQHNKQSSGTNKKNETRFLVYVKLSLLMGISWIFDAVEEEHWIYGVIDAFNACIGLFIFILFVCKRKLFLRLCARLSLDDKLVQSLRSRTTRSTQVTRSQQSTESEHGHAHGDRHPSTQGLTLVTLDR